jgi:hypothetical protein
MNHNYHQLLAKEEYDKLIKELQECSNLFLLDLLNIKK